MRSRPTRHLLPVACLVTLVRLSSWPADAQEEAEPIHTTGVVIKISAGQEVAHALVVPNWEKLVTVQEFGLDPEKELGEADWDMVILHDDARGKELAAHEGKMVAIIGNFIESEEDQVLQVEKFRVVADEKQQGVAATAKKMQSAEAGSTGPGHGAHDHDHDHEQE